MTTRPDSYTDSVRLVARVGLSHGSVYFTDGRTYSGQRVAAHSRLFLVRDDKGRERFVIPGERCPHFLGNDWPLHSAGRFEVVGG